MKIDDVMRKDWKIRINSIKAYSQRPYNPKEKVFDKNILKMHLGMPYRDAVSYYIENMIKKRLQRYED